MAQSSSNLPSSSPAGRWKTWLDRAALTGLIASCSLYVQPWWTDGLRVGFFATLGFTVLHITTSHLSKPDQA